MPIALFGFPQVDVSSVGGFLTWNIFKMPVLIIAFLIFFIAGLAESNRTPFDLPESESELIGGYHTEYSGFRWGLFMLTEYGMMLLISFLAAFLFFGGWYSPLPNIGSVALADLTNGPVWGIFWLLSKTMFFIFIQMMARWTYPRLRGGSADEFVVEVPDSHFDRGCVYCWHLENLDTMSRYFSNIVESVKTMSGGLKLTLRYLFQAVRSRKPIGISEPDYFEVDTGIMTLQYPHESLPVPETGRYRLHNEIDDCIVCDKCAKICPVDCIEIEPIKDTETFGTTSDGTPKRIHAAKFDIDMGKCCFCGLCTTVCPTECLTMD